MLKQSLIVAYATLVRAEKYILSESDRQDINQKLVSDEYMIAVAEYLVK